MLDDLIEQSARGRANLFEICSERLRLIRAGLILQHLGIADDLIEWRADFMIDPGRVGSVGPGLVGIEEIVDDAEQIASGSVNVFEVRHRGLAPRILRLLDQHLAVADDVIQRRAQLVLEAFPGG